jgi:hypothetical protein
VLRVVSISVRRGVLVCASLAIFTCALGGCDLSTAPEVSANAERAGAGGRPSSPLLRAEGADAGELEDAPAQRSADAGSSTHDKDAGVAAIAAHAGSKAAASVAGASGVAGKAAASAAGASGAAGKAVPSLAGASGAAGATLAGTGGAGAPVSGALAAGGGAVMPTEITDAELEMLRQTCVAEVNRYRSMVGALPIKRATPEQETCAADGLQLDADMNTNHTAINLCGKLGISAENSCPGYRAGTGTQPGTVADVLSSCLKSVWASGPPDVSPELCAKDPSCYSHYGAYLNMIGDSVAVACSFVQKDDDSYYLSQDFSRL